MKGILKTGLLAIAVSALAASASAQYNKPMGLSFRAGLFMSQGAAKAAEGQNWFTLGFEKKMKDGKMDGGNATMWTLSADYYGKGSFSNIPVLYNYVNRGEDFYWSAGAGVGFTHLPGGSQTEFAFQLSIGKDFVKSNQPLFIEARYWGCGESSLAGFSVVGGIRF